MKVLAVFLSFIVVLLSSIPCCAFESGEELPSIEQNGMAGDDDCGSDCSPFYTCGACAGFTVVEYSGELVAVYLKPVQHDSIYLPFTLPKTATSIWQPPKLS